MTYKINKTDGSLLSEIIDSEIDQTATDLTLIGKNVTGYGEYINENFVKLLENFASTSQPNFPITGQIWFDISENRLKVYDGDGFRIASGPIVSTTAPINPIQGDFWIDSRENQLYFYDGVDRQLAGPIYKDSQGISGFEIDTITDTSGNSKTVTKLWSNANLIGIWSHHPEFTPTANIPNFTGSVKPGFNPSNTQGFKFHGTALRAETLVDSLGNVKTFADFVSTTGNSTINPNPSIPNSPTIFIRGEEPLLLGPTGESKISVNIDAFTILTNSNNTLSTQDFIVKNSTSGVNAITVKNSTNRIGIFKNSPSAMLDVGGDVVIDGNLTVNGATVTINSSTLSIDDKFIVLADTSSPSDTLADGGGILLKGTTDHSILWNNATDSWSSSENFNIAAGKTYRINNIEVLSDTTLASSVTTALGLIEIGTLTSLQVDNVTINGSTISTAAGNLVLDPAASGLIDVRNSRIMDLQGPIDPKDAANKEYIDNLIEDPWLVVSTNYNASSTQRLQVDTVSTPIIIGLPQNAVSGNTLKIIDYSSTFDINNLTIARYRKNTVNGAGNGVAVNTGTFINLPAETITGIGSGLIVTVLISATGTYTTANTTVTPTVQGYGYKSGDRVRILGSNFGPGSVNGVNDLYVDLTTLDNMFGVDEDIIVSSKGAAFGLIYNSPGTGWTYSETLEIPPTITSDLIGDVTGNLTGTVLTASQSNITSVGTLLNLTVSGTINGNLTGNVTGNTTGVHFGDVTGNTITAPASLALTSTLGDIKLKSGIGGLRISAVDDTDVLEHYTVQVVSATAPTNRTKTLLFGDVVVENVNSTNVKGSSFRLPYYTTTERNDRTYTSDNYGELIYNTTLNKVQVYTNLGWVDLH